MQQQRAATVGVRHFAGSESGATVMEFALLASLASVVAILALLALLTG
ncbi:hypothetical protein [Rugamonas sp.]|nr:hypothetical protein [Rugamonas sp.]